MAKSRIETHDEHGLEEGFSSEKLFHFETGVEST
jgi:hypothetical protein